MPKYAIGVDFGTLSGRAVLVELGTSRELASSVWNYEYGVMDERLPDGTPLPADWALQMPADYLAVLSHAVPAVLREGRVAPPGRDRHRHRFYRLHRHRRGPAGSRPCASCPSGAATPTAMSSYGSTTPLRTRPTG